MTDFIPVPRETLQAAANQLKDPMQFTWRDRDALHKSLRALLSAPPKPTCEHNYLVSASYGGKLCSKCGKPEKHK
jgi:hypothetical protein